MSVRDLLNDNIFYGVDKIDKEFEAMIINQNDVNLHSDKMVVYHLIITEINKIDKTLKKTIKNKLLNGDNINNILLNLIDEKELYLGNLDWFLKKELLSYIDEDIVKKFF